MNTSIGLLAPVIESPCPKDMGHPAIPKTPDPTPVNLSVPYPTWHTKGLAVVSATEGKIPECDSQVWHSNETWSAIRAIGL